MHVEHCNDDVAPPKTNAKDVAFGEQNNAVKISNYVIKCEMQYASS